MFLNFGFAGCCINNFLQDNLLLEKDHNVDNLLFKPHHKMSNKVGMPSEVLVIPFLCFSIATKISAVEICNENNTGNQDLP